MANKLRVLNFSGLDIEQNTWFYKGLYQAISNYIICKYVNNFPIQLVQLFFCKSY